MSELKPCPCGADAMLVSVKGESYGLHNGEEYTSVECSSCSFNAADTDDWNVRAPQSKWISVDDRLPSNWADVLVFDGPCNEVLKSYYNEVSQSFEVLYSTHTFAKITHWMPLPNPPETK